MFGLKHPGAVVFAVALGTVMAAAQSKAPQTPAFEYDPGWPKPLPNFWTIGAIGALSIDARDHVWIAHRPASTNSLFERHGLLGEAECCFPAPPVIEFDPAGNVVQAWGPVHESKGELLGKQIWSGPAGLQWPANEHGILVDDRHAWVGNSNPPSQILKFTRDGKFIMRIGNEEAKSGNDTASMAGPTQMIVDPKTNELLVADGYRNRRIVVFDADTGAYKRSWGAYRNRPPDAQGSGPFEGGPDWEKYVGMAQGTFNPAWVANLGGKPSQQFATVHCLVMSRDRLLYVCDRANNRVQVFRMDGTFVREGTVRPETRGAGSAHAIGLSPDQQFLYLADGVNKKVWILRRSDLTVLGSFSSGGRMGGQVMIAHALGVDSKGNVYVGETINTNRVQKFRYVGMRPAPAMTR
jgi:hypothetical protein